MRERHHARTPGALSIVPRREDMPTPSRGYATRLSHRSRSSLMSGGPAGHPACVHRPAVPAVVDLPAAHDYHRLPPTVSGVGVDSLIKESLSGVKTSFRPVDRVRHGLHRPVGLRHRAAAVAAVWRILPCRGSGAWLADGVVLGDAVHFFADLGPSFGPGGSAAHSDLPTGDRK